MLADRASVRVMPAAAVQLIDAHGVGLGGVGEARYPHRGESPLPDGVCPAFGVAVLACYTGFHLGTTFPCRGPGVLIAAALFETTGFILRSLCTQRNSFERINFIFHRISFKCRNLIALLNVVVYTGQTT